MLRLFNKKSNQSLFILYIASFLLSLATALPAYIQSSLIGVRAGLGSVSVFFLAAYVLTLAAIIYFPRIIRRLGCYPSFKLVGTIFLLSLIGLSISYNYWLLLGFFILNVVSGTVAFASLDILINRFSNKEVIGETRTIYFSAINLAWILSPMIASFLIEKSGYGLVYLSSVLVVIPFLILVTANKKLLRDTEKYNEEPISQSLKKMFEDKNRRGIYALSFLLNLFYSSAVIFLPIYLQKLGFSWVDMGWMFSIMLVPFIIFEIPAGIVADRYWGEKEMLSAGFFILTLSLLIFFSLKSLNPFVWAAVLFLSRVGASLVEAMCQSYFFKHVSKNDINLINLFRSPVSLGYLFGSALSVITILFLPINFLFLFLAILMLSAFPILMTIKDTK
jgi:MFS family permease